MAKAKRLVFFFRVAKKGRNTEIALDSSPCLKGEPYLVAMRRVLLADPKTYPFLGGIMTTKKKGYAVKSAAPKVNWEHAAVAMADVLSARILANSRIK